MKITPNGVTNTPLTPNQPVQPAPTPLDQGASAAPQDASGYTPSSAWLRLLDHLGQQPAIRDDRVASAIMRMRDGVYATPDSAAKTAEAMVQSQE